jgi:hypothetical protein
VTTPATITRERADLLETLARHRDTLRRTLDGLTDEQAGLRSTASELCLGGLIKHVASAERGWTGFLEISPTAPCGGIDWNDPDADWSLRDAEFRMGPGDTVDGVLAMYSEVAAHTDDVLRTWPDLDVGEELPPAPWFAPGLRWSARRVFLHLISEVSQHAGHAEILREAIDGRTSTG